MRTVIQALIEMEQFSAKAAEKLQSLKDKLPARIQAETAHIQQLIGHETEQTLLQLHVEIDKAGAARMQEIETESARLLAEAQARFNLRREALRADLFEQVIGQRL